MVTAAPTVTLPGLLAARCGNVIETNADQALTTSTGRPRQTPMPPPSRIAGDDWAGEPAESQENRMNIQITIGDQTFAATLHDSPAARDLVAFALSDVYLEARRRAGLGG